jgi:hypothetical protein
MRESTAIMEQIIGRVVGGGGIFGAIFGEAREAVLGGCWGLIMSAAFFFFFFATGMAMLGDVSNFPPEYQLNWNSFFLIALLCVSGLASPVIGVLFGLQTGFYSVFKHIVAFAFYIILILAGIVALSLFNF